VSRDQILRIAKWLGMSPESFRREHTRRLASRRSLLERENGDCEFLERGADGKARCAIHPVRPTQCRTWPFWKSNLTSPRAWELAARSCPGMNRGRRYSLTVIQQALQRNRDAALSF
jgi:hypothetical protein